MKRLYRNKSDVMIAGVCSGLGEYLDVDPTAVRLAFVLLLFAGFSGLWIYLVLWIIIPEKPKQENVIIDVKEEKKTPAPKKAAVPKQPAAKRSTVKKTTAKKTVEKKQATRTKPAKKPAQKQPTKKTTSRTKPEVKSRPVEEKKE